MYLQGLGLCFQPSAFVPESGAKKTACRLMFPVFVTSMAPDPLDSPHGLGAYGSVPEPATPPPPRAVTCPPPGSPGAMVTAGSRSPLDRGHLPAKLASRTEAHSRIDWCWALSMSLVSPACGRAMAPRVNHETLPHPWEPWIWPDCPAEPETLPLQLPEAGWVTG